MGPALRVGTLVVVASASACAARSVERSGPDWKGQAERVWDVRRGEFVDFGALEERARSAHFVLLGETHDNPDHHRLQAALLRAVAARGRRPAVAFEMLDVSQQSAVSSAKRDDPDAIARAVDWEKSGWPDYAYYRPIFEVAGKSHLPIVAANLSREDARKAIKDGASALPVEVRERLVRDEPFPEGALQEMRQEMRDSHCGALPEQMIDPMVLAQRARDAQLALSMERGDSGEGVVLIAGAGHVRGDRGVPRLLERDRPDDTVLSVGMVEAPDRESSPGSASSLPFDYVVFTPAMERPDPCGEGNR